MQTYIVNNLAVKAEQINEDFTLDSEGELFKGRAGDYIIFEDGKQRGCAKLAFEQQYSVADEESIKKKQFHLDMIKGYIEMAEINKEIANEMNHLEVEADVTLDRYRTTYW